MMSDPIAEAFDTAIRKFGSATDKNDNQLGMKYFGISHEGRRLVKAFSRDAPVDLRSVSKPVVSLTLGALVESEVHVKGSPLTLDTLVGPLLDRHFTSSDERASWERVRVRHLLTNTAGHDQGFFFRKDIADVDGADLVHYALRQPIMHEPGTHFSYSNVGPFLLSVILQDHLGKNLLQIARDRVLDPLAIEADWRCYGDYTAGCTGLSMSGADLLTFGEMVLAGGASKKGRTVQSSWISAASTVQIESPGMFDPSRVFPKYGYGYGFWICEDGSFYCDGTDGQYLIIVPNSSLVIVTTGAQPDMKPITRCMVPVLQAVGAR